jgi:GNAT superfamily N-acetyltransferase
MPNTLPRPRAKRVDAIVTYACHLQRQHTDELGFLPAVAIREYAERGQIIVATENHDPISYVLFYTGRNGNRPKRNPRTCPIHQLCTQYDARRLAHATNLLNQVIDIATATDFRELRAWVAHDLPANDFWNAFGFHNVAQRWGGERRNRLHNLWIFELPDPPTQPATPAPHLHSFDPRSTLHPALKSRSTN